MTPTCRRATYRGTEAVRRVLEPDAERVRADSRSATSELLPAGDRVVALIRTYPRARRSDLEVEVRDAHTMTFRDGKIVYWRLYLDQAEALTDAGLDPELARPPARGRLARAYASPVGSRWRTRRRCAARWSQSVGLSLVVPWARGRSRTRARRRRTERRTRSGRAPSIRRPVPSGAAQALRRLPGRRLLRGHRPLAGAARLRLRPPVQLGERQQGAAARGRAAAARARGPAARRRDQGPAGADDHLLRQPGRGCDLRTGRRRGTRGGRGAGRYAGLRADARLLGRRPDHRRRHGAILLPARGQPARPPPRLRDAATRAGSRRSSAGESRGGRARLVDLVQGRLAAARRQSRTAGRSPTRRPCWTTAAASGWRSRSSRTRRRGRRRLRDDRGHRGAPALLAAAAPRRLAPSP